MVADYIGKDLYVIRIMVSPKPRPWQGSEINLSMIRTSVQLKLKASNLDRMQTHMPQVSCKRVKKETLLETKNRRILHFFAQALA